VAIGAIQALWVPGLVKGGQGNILGHRFVAASTISNAGTTASCRGAWTSSWGTPVLRVATWANRFASDIRVLAIAEGLVALGALEARLMVFLAISRLHNHGCLFAGRARWGRGEVVTAGRAHMIMPAGSAIREPSRRWDDNALICWLKGLIAVVTLVTWLVEFVVGVVG